MILSIVIPCCNEEKNIRPIYDAIRSAIPQYWQAAELIFVNDGSKDKTLTALRALYQKDPAHVKIIDFSRNFGKEAALLAGMRLSTGDMVSIVDADLQQKPSYISDMVAFLLQHPEYDAVAAFQEKRREGRALSFFKDAFYKIMGRLTEIDIVQSASDFRTMRRPVVDAVLSLPESCRFSKGIFSWVGFKTYYMPYEVQDRAHGTTKWSFTELVAYALDGIVAFSTKPLVFSAFIGMILCLCALVYLVVIVLKTLIFGNPVMGFPTLATLILFSSGVQLLFLGVIGQYLAKIYTEAKKRPPYVIRKTYRAEPPAHTADPAPAAERPVQTDRPE